MKPVGAGEEAAAIFSVPSAVSGLSYAGKGGNVSSEAPNVDEYAAEARRYGMGMSRAVRASGRENHDVDAAGISSNVGWYAVPRTLFTGRPRSDSPLGRELFIGECE